MFKLFTTKKSKHHFTAEDIYFLYIPAELQRDIVRLVDTLYNNNFIKDKKLTREPLMFLYEYGIKRWPWSSHYSYMFKAVVFMTNTGKFVPLVMVKDLKTKTEFDPLRASKHDITVVQRTTDRILNHWIDIGFIKIFDEGIKEYLNR
jgi:hypothetical protein